MDSQEATDRVMGALKPYFSPPIAKALLGMSMRRANLPADGLTFESIPTVVGALERALPAYIADQGRRNDCLQALRRLLALAPRAAGTNGAAHGSIAKVAAFGAPPIPTITVVIRSADDVTSACEGAREIARQVGFSHVDQTKVATAVSELARNILLYAGSGEVRLSGVSAPRRGIEAAAVDRGPGIADVAVVMSNSYRSRTGMGMGLKGAKRLTDSFELTSSPGVGTTVVIRKFLS
jgi:serine/threonine-protein kinase RsbT